MDALNILIHLCFVCFIPSLYHGLHQSPEVSVSNPISQTVKYAFILSRYYKKSGGQKAFSWKLLSAFRPRLLFIPDMEYQDAL